MDVDLRNFKRVTIGGLEVVDVRCAFPDLPAPCPFVPPGDPYNPGRLWPVSRMRHDNSIEGELIHNDGVFFAPGDRDYDGSTLDEDAERLQAIYRQGLKMGWGGMPYHAVASPNQGALYVCRDHRTFGAHVGGNNHRYVGVAIMGNFDFAMPSTVALCGAGKGVALMRFQYRLPGLPLAGHRDVPGQSTTCPGNTWPSWRWTLTNLAALWTSRAS